MSTGAELKKIEEKEERILKTEKEILEKDRSIISILGRFRSVFVNRISKRKIIFGLLVTVGIVAVWRGTWYVLDEVSWLSSPYASIAFGIILLLALKKVNDLTSH